MASRKLKYGLILLPALFYFLVVNHYALNIPSQDDYDAILKYLHYYNNVHGIDKFWSLFQQHNEHRILSSRLLYVLYYSIFGAINFRSIIFIGNLQLLFTFLLFVSFVRKLLPAAWLVPSVIAALCFFSLNNWENADFAMASVQNYGVVFLFVASLYCYQLNGRLSLIPAVLLQLICTFSSGNGMVASAFLVLFNVLSKDKLKMWVCIASFVAFTPLYFISYSRPVTEHVPPTIWGTIIYFFRFAGAYVLNKPISVVFGIAIAAVMGILVIGKRLYRDRNVLLLLCVAGFLVSSMMVTSIFRSAFGAFVASRYLVYANLLFATGSVLWLYTSQIPSKFYKPIIGFSLVVFALSTYSGIRGFSKLRTTIETTDYYYPHPEVARGTAAEACEARIYCIEQHR